MSQNFFTSRLGRDVIRIAPDGRESIITVASYKLAEYLHSLQDHGYRFKEKLEIHNKLEECQSCSA